MRTPTPERHGYDRLWLWFEISRAGWLTIPRVLLHEMPDDWQDKMAALLEEYEQTFTNWPEGIGTRVIITDGNKLCPFHKWLHDYRHPAYGRISNLRARRLRFNPPHSKSKSHPQPPAS